MSRLRPARSSSPASGDGDLIELPVPTPPTCAPARRSTTHLLALLPLVGVWRGTGTRCRRVDRARSSATASSVSFAHDGRPFLAYESRSLAGRRGRCGDPAGLARVRLLAARAPVPDDVEVVVADAAGLVEVFAGVAGDNRWELVTTGRQRHRNGPGGGRRAAALRGRPRTRCSTRPSSTPAAASRPHLNARLRPAPDRRTIPWRLCCQQCGLSGLFGPTLTWIAGTKHAEM